MIRGVEPNAPFDRVCRLIGSYAAVGAIFSPPVSAQAVAKWAKGGVPADRVIDLARAVGYEVTPHELHSEIYPNPTDGLPLDFVVGESFLKKLEERREGSS